MVKSSQNQFFANISLPIARKSIEVIIKIVYSTEQSGEKTNQNALSYDIVYRMVQTLMRFIHVLKYFKNFYMILLLLKNMLILYRFRNLVQYYTNDPDLQMIRILSFRPPILAIACRTVFSSVINYVLNDKDGILVVSLYWMVMQQKVSVAYKFKKCQYHQK